MRRKNINGDTSTRVNFLFGTYMLVMAIFLARLFDIQVLNHRRYTALAQDQYWNLSVLPAKRGDILTSDGIVLAGTQTHYLMYAEPKKILNPHETAVKLTELMIEMKSLNNETNPDENFDPDSYYKNLLDSNIKKLTDDLYWVVVDRNITPVQKEKIESLEIYGIGFEEEPVRYYPESSLASHVLGFVAFNERGEKQGYFGIEGYLNGDLKGKEGRILEELDAVGRPILVGGYKKSEPIKGRDIVTTINRTVQYIVEKKLKEGVENYDAKSGTVIVMDPFTGEIVAMANYPTYSPDYFGADPEEDPEAHRHKIEKRNLGISQTYEPGSVIKPLTVASAVELGLVGPNTTFVDSGPVQYSDYVIDNWDGKHHGVQTVTQLLEKSNNIGAAWVGHLVGSKDLSYYFKEFGLGTKTDVELEGEDTGIIRDYVTWTDIDLANIAFGQGISATPLQVLNSFNVLANGGFLIQPKIVSQIIDEGDVIDLPHKQVERVITKETSETMVSMLESAVESGEAKYFILDDYRVAGKTGTAQIPVNGKYDPEKTNATFVGFMSNNKEFSMIVKLEEPRSSVYAAETAVPLWMAIAEELVKFYGIAPDKE